MYARVMTVRTDPDRLMSTARGERLVRAMAHLPGFGACYLLRQLETGRGMSVSLWASEPDAGALEHRLTPIIGAPPVNRTDETYRVLEDSAGPASEVAPAVASLLHFDGPIGQARFDAGRRAHRDRIGPAIARVPGHVRTLVLWQPDEAAILVLALAESFDALEAGQRAVLATELRPGEDPALLSTPDRAETWRCGPMRVRRPAVTAS